MSDFKARLKELRESRGFSIIHVAEDFSKTEAAIRAWETGRTKPGLDDIIKLADYYGVTTDFLLGLSEIPDSDMDADAINKATGLSPESIKALQWEKRGANANDRIPTEYLKAINVLIEQGIYKGVAIYLFTKIPPKSYITMQLRDGNATPEELNKARLADPRSKDHFINPNEYAPVFESIDLDDGEFLLRAYMEQITDALSSIRKDLRGELDATEKE